LSMFWFCKIMWLYFLLSEYGGGCRTTTRFCSGFSTKITTMFHRRQHRSDRLLFNTHRSMVTTPIDQDQQEQGNATKAIDEIIIISSTQDEPPQKKKKKSRRLPPFPPPPIPTPSDFPDWAYESRDFFKFEIINQSTKSQARVGRIHGTIDTPGYVAVATNAALKGLDFRQADEAGQQLIFANMYHLLLHLLLNPGADLTEQASGIHKFTNRQDRPFITDSGGFQVFSLAYGSVNEELTSKGELKQSGNQSKHRRQDSMGKDAVKVSKEGAIF